jgi:hypothetical protein
MTFRIRNVDANGDMLFGHSGADFLVDSPAAVGLLVKDRLNLWEGEYFLNLLEGTPWFQNILGKQPSTQTSGAANAGNVRDAALQYRINTTPFVTGIDGYNSQISAQRVFTAAGSLKTAFGILPNFNVPIVQPSGFGLGVTPIGGGGLG